MLEDLRNEAAAPVFTIPAAWIDPGVSKTGLKSTAGGLKGTAGRSSVSATTEAVNALTIWCTLPKRKVMMVTYGTLETLYEKEEGGVYRPKKIIQIPLALMKKSFVPTSWKGGRKTRRKRRKKRTRRRRKMRRKRTLRGRRRKRQRKKRRTRRKK